MAKSFPAATAAHHAPVLSQARTAPSVRAWLDSCSRHQPLSERTVLELSRCIHRWQQHPDGPDLAPRRCAGGRYGPGTNWCATTSA